MKDYKLICKTCNKEYFRSNDKFCSDCGEELEKVPLNEGIVKLDINKHCFECGANYTDTRKNFCNICGHKLVNLPQEAGILSAEEIKNIAMQGLRDFENIEIDIETGVIGEKQTSRVDQVRGNVLHCFNGDVDYNDKDFVFCLECSNELAKFTNSDGGDLLKSLRNWEIVICDKDTGDPMECTLGVFTGTFTELVSKFSGCRFDLKLIPTTKKAYFDSSRLVYKRVVNTLGVAVVKGINVEVILDES